MALDSLSADSKLRLPKPERATLTAFSLYEQATTITVNLEADGVFCLVGANGLGKSTFLSALNYAITGVVAQPGRDFRGVADYYGRVRPYATNYFRGRISDEAAEAAEIEVVMRVGDHRYRIVRGMFDPDRLRELEITTVATGERVLEDDPVDEGERHALYTTHIIRDAGLESFAQLVFVQLFVLTFDERRELLFWNPRVLQASLYIAFGLDPERARRADTLAKKVEGAESRARNFQWQATNLRKQMDALRAAGDEMVEGADDSAESHRAMQTTHNDAAKRVEELRAVLADTQLRIATQSAELRALRNEYDALWAQRLQGHGHPSSHPVVTTSLADAQCALCGTSSDQVVETIQARIAGHHCPLCDSELAEAGGNGHDELLARLATLDAEILAQQKALAAADQASDRLGGELEVARESLRAITSELARFEQENESALLKVGGGTGGLEALADRYRVQISELHGRRDAERGRRDEARAELQPLQDTLAGAYTAAEDDFVPNFRRLATAFLGLDLSVDFEVRRDTVGLLLTVEGTRRRGQDALSESQRYFVDIALRMALAQQMSSPAAPACLYVDTPEGSLDIAYESRAGQMFGMFIQAGYQMVMTANINTSQLLHRLAETCGPEHMKLERMTEWTALTEVQASEAELFESAWLEIVAALGPGT